MHLSTKLGERSLDNVLCARWRKYQLEEITVYKCIPRTSDHKDHQIGVDSTIQTMFN